MEANQVEFWGGAIQICAVFALTLVIEARAETRGWEKSYLPIWLRIWGALWLIAIAVAVFAGFIVGVVQLLSGVWDKSMVNVEVCVLGAALGGLAFGPILGAIGRGFILSARRPTD